MASPFEQAAARPFGLPNLPQPPTLQSLFQQAYPNLQLSPSFDRFGGFTPDQLQRMSQARGYLENLDPSYAQQRFYEDPSNQYQHAMSVWRTLNQNLAQNWYDAKFRDTFQRAGLQTPYMRFTDFLRVHGYSDDMLNRMASWYQGGQVPQSQSLNVDAIRQALGYAQPYQGPTGVPADLSTSNPQATAYIVDWAAREGGPQAALNTFRNLSAQGRMSVARALNLSDPAAIEAQLQALIARNY